MPRNGVIWGFLALIVVQSLLLLTYYSEEVGPFPPRYYDQALALSESYTLSFEAQHAGLVRVLLFPLEGRSPKGAVFAAEGAMLDLFAGGGRLSQLLLNFVAFVLVETVLYGCVTYATGNIGLGLAALGLFLTQRSMWNGAGGIFDFRIDFLALCLYGVAVCALLRAQIFASRRWTVAAALAMLVLILNRYITAVYILCLMITIISFAALVRSRVRVIHASTCLIALGICAFPFMFASRVAIYNYYVVGDILGPEKAIRAAQEGVTTWWDAMRYYPVSIIAHHLGLPYFVACLCLLVGILMCLARTPVQTRRRAWTSDVALEPLLVVAGVLFPLVILTLDVLKTPVVGGIVCVPLALFVVLLPHWIGLVTPNARIWHWTGAVIMALGLMSQFEYSTRDRFVSERDNSRRWTDASAWVFDDARARDLTSPRIFLDTISDSLNYYVFTAFGYERTRSLIAFKATIGDSIFSFDRQKAMSALLASDYVMLTSGPKAGAYPFFASMAEVEPQVRAWTERNLIFRRRFDVDGEFVDFYSRPLLELAGVSGDWLVARGTTLRLIPSELKHGEIAVLRGPDSYRSLLPKSPQISATALVAGHDSIRILATFEHRGGEYEIDVDPSPLRCVVPGEATVALSFDHAFVPKELGINADARELVVLAPTDAEFRPRSETHFKAGRTPVTRRECGVFEGGPK